MSCTFAFHRVNAVTRLMVTLAIAGANAYAAPPQAPHARETRLAFALPDWSVDARWYEIDIPRFHNGDPNNDLPGTVPWTWEGPPPAIASETPPPPRRHFGGDLAGIIARLPYLQSLGVNTLYLRAVFHGTTDTPPRPADMRHIDSVFGVAQTRTGPNIDKLDLDHWTVTESDRLFFEFLKSAHEAGFRVVVRFDTGFRRRRGNMRIDQDLTSTPYLRAIARRWSDPNGDGDPGDGVDGWVVTVASGERDGAVAVFAETVRRLNPNALLVSRGDLPKDVAALELPAWSEVFMDAFVRTFQPQRRAVPHVVRLFPTVTGQPGHLSGLPVPGTPIGFPITKRAVTQCSLSSDVNALPDEQAYARYRLALLVQYFLPGAPVTLCGSEVGMYGGESDLTSAPMWWKDLETPSADPPHYRDDLLALFRWLNKFRDENPVLSRGAFRSVTLDEEKRLLAFARTAPDGEIALAVNYGPFRQTTKLKLGVPGRGVTVLSPSGNMEPFVVATADRTCGDDGFVSVDIEPMSGVIVRTHPTTTKP